MSLFDRFRKRRDMPSGPPPSGKTVGELRDFLRTRDGVEAYVEPPTPVYAMSLCLVAADGEYMRRPVKGERQARELCSEHGVPMYDARIVGYPKRMREYQRGEPARQVRLEDLPPLEVSDDDPEPRED